MAGVFIFGHLRRANEGVIQNGSILAHVSPLLMIVVFDTALSRRQLYPLSLTRPIADLRVGTTTLAQWWGSLSGQPVCSLSEKHLTPTLPRAAIYHCIDATVLPDVALCSAILQLQPGEVLEDAAGIVAFCTTTMPAYAQFPVWSTGQPIAATARRFEHSSTLVQLNAGFIQQTVSAAPWPPANEQIQRTNTLIGNQLYMAASARMQACIINTEEGPVVIDEQALVMEGCIIRGPVYIGKGTVVKAGARVYGGTSIGERCTVGGEIKQSIFHDYSNKAHDGYLGDSYIGAWCNLGAGTSNSNVKNTAGTVQVWQQAEQRYIPAGVKAGTIMGDYSRTAINTSLNTGCCVGVCCSLHEAGIFSGHIPSFSWGISTRYQLEKAVEHIRNWKRLKGQELTEAELHTLSNVFNHHSA